MLFCFYMYKVTFAQKLIQYFKLIVMHLQSFVYFKIVELTISFNSQEYSVAEGNFVVIMINANKQSGTPYEAYLTIPGAEVTGRLMTSEEYHCLT